MKHGKYRSRFEAKVAAVLPKGTRHEPKKFAFPLAHPLYRCGACGSKDVKRTAHYLPDFLLPNGTFVEAKGRLDASGRKKLIAWKAHYPNETVRLVFMADNKISKTSGTRYSDWATKAGFEFCVGINNIPQRWYK